jgi:hypothetical protein
MMALVQILKTDINSRHFKYKMDIVNFLFKRTDKRKELLKLQVLRSTLVHRKIRAIDGANV